MKSYAFDSQMSCIMVGFKHASLEGDPVLLCDYYVEM